ncbi:MAG TPA: glycoside hydrolase family 16 protein [Kiritimatiellia bacterium]|nr:glycoside hydrolase family 16 protein [Kiritimatiellia bacterium]
MKFTVVASLLLLLAGVLLPCASAPAGLYSNVLVNPGFEYGDGDLVVSNWFRFEEAHRYAANARSGSYALLMWGDCWPVGTVNVSGVCQDIPTTEGQLWEGAIWAMANSNLQGSALGAVNLEFLNAATQVIFSGSSPVKITSATPTQQWIRLVVRGRATRNTTMVRLAPVFVQPACENSAVWFDDAELYLAATNMIRFADRDWMVLDQPSSPGENYYSSNCVSVDANGWLHMKLERIGGVWHCPFIEGTQHLGFGEYRWYVGNKLEQIDSNLVVGLFNYAQESVFNTNQIEVDIEVSHAFPGTQTNCLVYTVQPYTIPGNSYSHPLETTNDVTTHRFVWRPDRIDWASYYGHTPEPESTNHYLAGWRFEGRGIPIETNEVAYMNLWLFYTNAPVDTQRVEMIIRDFEFIPFDGFILADDFEDGVLSNQWVVLGGDEASAVITETNGCLSILPSVNGGVAGYATAAPVHRNERGERYVFSAWLNSVTVSVARAGEDVRVLCWLSSETNVERMAPAAMMLQGNYDSADDTLTFTLYAKTNDPGEIGGRVFEGAVTSVTSRLAAGGLEVRMELGLTDYDVGLNDSAGLPVMWTTNAGSAEGLHELGESLCYGYWCIGAENSDLDAQGLVTWSRAAVGVDAQEQLFAVETGSAAASGNGFSFSGQGFFDTRYSVYRTTNLMENFVCILSNAACVTSPIVFTDSVSAASGYYRMEVR